MTDKTDVEVQAVAELARAVHHLAVSLSVIAEVLMNKDKAKGDWTPGASEY
jgi:hypothetical protein